MPKYSIYLGIILLILGLAGYFLISSESITALIPSFFGILFFLLGVIGSGGKYLKHTMHAAAILALLGIAGTFRGLINSYRLFAGPELDRPEATAVQAIMAVLCLIFLVLAIRSFIAARKKTGT